MQINVQCGDDIGGPGSAASRTMASDSSSVRALLSKPHKMRLWMSTMKRW